MLAKDLSEDPRTSTLCGSKEYFAPEQVSSGNGHALPVDIWQLGIFVYELINGSTPFSSDNVQDGGEKGMYDRIIAHKSGSLTAGEGISKQCLDFINKLVVQNEKKRLPASKLSKHAWFADFDFDALKNGTMVAPFVDIVESKQKQLYAGRSGRGEGKSSKGGKTKVTTVPYLGDPDWFEGF